MPWFYRYRLLVCCSPRAVQKQAKPIIRTDKDVDKVDDEELLYKMVSDNSRQAISCIVLGPP